MSRDDRKKGNIAQFPKQESVREQASLWIARLDGGPLSEREHAEFQEWINRSPANRAEIRRLCAFWNELNDLTALTEAGAPVRQRSAVRYRIAGALAASAALLLLVVSLTFLAVPEPSQLPDFHAVDIGAQKTVELQDGSVMQLNTGSHAKIEYTDDVRRIRLLNGEAYFDVAHDPDRPFLVEVGGTTVRAVGTAFLVHLRQRDLEVLVTEGVVELFTEQAADTGLADTAAPAPQPVAISAGQRAVRTDDSESLQPVTAQDIQRKLAWRDRVLAFFDTPLSEVVSEMSRYTSTTIMISDPELGQLRIGGYFKLGETDALLGALESSFGVRVIRVDDKLVYLAAAE